LSGDHDDSDKSGELAKKVRRLRKAKKM